jgi:hypothetical protein
MGDDPKAVDDALASVHRTLDRLTSRGQSDAAFEIARAHFAASVRASWPANLSAVAAAIDRALSETTLALTTDEIDELRNAAEVLRAIPHP